MMQEPVGRLSGRPVVGRWPLAAIVPFLCLLPIFVTPVVPSIDFYAHVVRYHVLAHPAGAELYQPAWRLLPNLGMDFLGTAVMWLLPPLIGAKLLAAIVILAPMLGAMRLARSLDGRLDPGTAALAGLLSYNLILFWGFANFLLGLGLMLWSFGWWLSMCDRPRRQLVGMAAIGVLVLFVHGLVFALWGLLLAMLELGLAIDERRARPLALLRRASRLLMLAVVPVLLFSRMRTVEATEGVDGAFQNLADYAERGGLWERLLEEALKRIDSILRVVESSWPTPDRLFGMCLWAVLALAAWRGALRLDARLRPMAATAFVLIGLMPPNLFGVGHLDERMPLVFLAVLAAGSVTTQGWLRKVLAGLFMLHLALVTMMFTDAGRRYEAFLGAVREVDTGTMAAPAFFGNTATRDGKLFCTPLLFLLQLEKGTAVPTFANPTQQPLRLAPPLAAATQGLAAIAPGTGRSATLAQLAAAGFDTAVTCDEEDRAPDVAGTQIVAQGPHWTIYSLAASP